VAVASPRIVCGFLGSAANHNPLVAALPKVLKLDIRGGAGGHWMESSFQFAARELSLGSDRVGTGPVETIRAVVRGSRSPLHRDVAV
jgi:hypothetical protein